MTQCNNETMLCVCILDLSLLLIICTCICSEIAHVDVTFFFSSPPVSFLFWCIYVCIVLFQATSFNERNAFLVAFQVLWHYYIVIFLLLLGKSILIDWLRWVSNVGPYVGLHVRWLLGGGWRVILRRYAVRRDPRSRSRALESWEIFPFSKLHFLRHLQW